MPCFFATSNRKKKLTVKSFSTNFTTSSGTTQLRQYAAPFTSRVTQDSISLQVQTRSRQDYFDTVSLLRQSQLLALNSEAKSTLIWPERNIAYEVFPKTVRVQAKLQDVAPVLQIDLGVYRDVRTTGLASFTGQQGSQKVIEDYISTQYSDLFGQPSGAAGNPKAGTAGGGGIR